MKAFLIAAAVVAAVLITLAVFDAGASAGAGGAGTPAGDNPVVVIETSAGTIKAELFADKSPETVKNILAYVDDKYYDGTIFHRVIKDFMIQGGGFTPGLSEKPHNKPSVKNESANGLENKRGTLAMARTREPHSATSQFYINTVDNDNLDRKNSADGFGYCVFGRVLEGLDVVDKIRAVKTGTTQSADTGVPYQDVPAEDVVIRSVRRAEKK